MIGRLKEIPILSGFGDEVLQELSEVTRELRCAGGETLFREGDEGDRMFIIDKGSIEIRKQGKTLAVLGDGAVFGEMALYEDAPRSADAVARVDTSMYAIGNQDFRAIIMRHPRHGVKFLLGNIGEMSRRLRATSRHLITLYETGKMVGSLESVTELCGAILARLTEDVAGASGGLVMLMNPFTGTYDETCRWRGAGLDLASAEASIAAHGGEKILHRSETGSLLGVPLKDADRLLGYIWIEKGGGESFSNEEQIIVGAVANQVGLGILNASHREEEANRRRLEQGRMRRL